MTNRTFHSIVWTGVERFGAQIFQAIFMIALARILVPEDYGLLAMIFIFLMIGQMLLDGGLSMALLQKKNPTENDFSTVFWFNLGFGILFYIVFFLSAPWIAKFYEQPLLVPIIKVAGLNFIIWSVSIIHGTKLYIALNFRKIAFITISAMILSGILGIVLAYHGYGVWALVFQFLINNLLRTIFFWLFTAPWYPRFIFSLNSFKSLIKFGYGYMFSNLLDTTFKNMFAVFIGKFYAVKELGFFQKANSLSSLPSSNAAYALSNSFIPIQTDLSGNPEEQRKSFDRFLSLKCFIIFPIAIFLAILAEPFVSFVLTDRWLPAVPFIQILCLGYLWYPVLVINRRMLLSKGFSKQNLIAEIIAKTFGVALFLICLPHGIYWICVAISVYAVFDMIVSMIFVQKILSIRWIEQLKIMLPVLGLALFSGFIAWLVGFGLTSYIFSSTNDFMKLTLGGISGLSVYLLGSYYLKFEEIKFMMSYLKNYTAKTTAHN